MAITPELHYNLHTTPVHWSKSDESLQFFSFETNKTFMMNDYYFSVVDKVKIDRECILYLFELLKMVKSDY